MLNFKGIASIAITLFTVSHAQAAIPSQGQILQWLTNVDKSSANPAKNIQIENTQKITLSDGEDAYLSGVTFQNAARNFWGGYILTRPKVQQSRILDFGGQSNHFEVHPTYSKF